MFLWVASIAADWETQCVRQDNMFDDCTRRYVGLQSTADAVSIAGIAGVVIAAGGAALMIRSVLGRTSPRTVSRGGRWRLGISHAGLVVGGTW
jgi:hypothetical protein